MEDTTSMRLRAISPRPSHPERPATRAEICWTVLAFVALFLLAWAGSVIIDHL